jgi:hypothetical protein
MSLNHLAVGTSTPLDLQCRSLIVERIVLAEKVFRFQVPFSGNLNTPAPNARIIHVGTDRDAAGEVAETYKTQLAVPVPARAVLASITAETANATRTFSVRKNGVAVATFAFPTASSAVAISALPTFAVGDRVSFIDNATTDPAPGHATVTIFFEEILASEVTAAEPLLAREPDSPEPLMSASSVSASSGSASSALEPLRLDDGEERKEARGPNARPRSTVPARDPRRRPPGWRGPMPAKTP